MSQRHRTSAVVIGGGLAGIAAAVRLAGAGVRVTLVERSPRLGGRATSFVDPVTGEVVDNCQHVLLGCCTNLIDCYRRLGVADRIRWHRRLYFCAPPAGTDDPVDIDVLESDDLPAPLHMTRALMAFKSLCLLEKLAIGRGMLAIMRLGARRSKLHDRTFAEWLYTLGQPQAAIEKFWAPIVTSACNELPQRVAADYAIQIFQEGFLANENAYVMGVPAVPLIELYQRAEQVMRDVDGELLLSTSAASVDYEQGRITALHLANGNTLHADAFVSAVPFDRLSQLCPPELLDADPRLGQLAGFEVSPIIGVHLWYSMPWGRPVMMLPHLVLLDSPLQWVFNKGVDDRGDSGRHYLHGVISAAHDLIDKPMQHIRALCDCEIRKVLPRARDAELLYARVIKEKRATFSASPGIDARRPTAQGSTRNLYLAGDWTATGWPATMEGAVRSGYLAASAVLRDQYRFASGLVPALNAGRLYRLIARSEWLDSDPVTPGATVS